LTSAGKTDPFKPLFGAGSQDYGNEDQRFTELTEDFSAIGNRFSEAFESLRALCPEAEAGPLSMPVAAIRPESNIDPKLRRDITKQIEDTRAKAFLKRHKNLAKTDRRRTSFENRLPSTMAFVATAPTEATEMPQVYFTGAAALVMGALDPTVVDALDSSIGNTNLRVDLFGDALGAAVLPSDRWRSAHGVCKHQIYLDAKFLGVAVKQEVYGMSARFFSPRGRDAYGSLNQAAKRRKTIIPDLVTSHHPADSTIHANGPQMWELKRVHSAQAISRDSGLPDGLNDYYRLRNRGRMVRAANRRADLVPSEYEAKAKKADEAFGAPGSMAVLRALRAIPTVRGIALGAFGEFSESINVLIQGLAHEGALKNPDKFGQSNY
jgi:hypothetical protein